MVVAAGVHGWRVEVSRRPPGGGRREDRGFEDRGPPRGGRGEMR